MTELSLTRFKRCPKCECLKPRTHQFFFIYKSGKVTSWCRVCSKFSAKEYGRRNKEQRKAYYKKWAKENRDKLAANLRRWVEANRELHNSRVRSWGARNLERYRAKERNRRALKHNAPGAHTNQDVREMYESQGGLCAYCEASLDGAYHVDHMVPLVRGGGNGCENLAVACAFCNLSKHDKTAEEFMKAVV